MNILLAEDEQDIRELITIQLQAEGYTVFAKSNGIDALKCFQSEEIDLLLLDVMLPRLDGFNLLRKIREASNVPAIFLTARGEEMDKVLGLGIGADDYIVKPFSMAELIARVNAQLRRTQEYNNSKKVELSTISYGNLCLDKDACCVYLNNELIDLNAKEYQLLLYLMEHPNKVFTKKQLYCAVWNDDYYYDDNTIMVHMSHLRSKIEIDSKQPQFLKTIRG